MKQDKIKHFILTRFNIPTPWEHERSIRTQDGWLEGRFKLFEDYCLPSIQNQTRQDFEWVIFFDAATPDKFKEKIRILQVIYPFKAVFVTSGDQPEMARNYFLALGSSQGWILTTTLDADDGLASNFVERLRENAASLNHKCAINFCYGISLYIRESGRMGIYSRRIKSNSFISLLEPYDENLQTVWKVVHSHIIKIANIYDITGAPAWLQVIHGGNVWNRHTGSKRILFKKQRDKFAFLASKISEEKSACILLENILLVPFRRIYYIVVVRRYYNPYLLFLRIKRALVFEIQPKRLSSR